MDITATKTNWEMAKDCIDIHPTRPQEYKLSGVVPIRSLNTTVVGLDLSLLDLEADTTKEIDTDNQSIWDVDVSPNRQTLAYTWFNNSAAKWELIIVDALGNPQEIVRSSDDIFGFNGWLTDRQLIFPQASSYTIVNLDDGSTEEIPILNFPDFVVYDQTRSYISFNPSLTRAIYKNGDIIHLDLNTKRITSKISDGYDRIPTVAWHLSNDQVAVVGTIKVDDAYGLSDEIFVAGQDEQFHQLTDLHNSFGEAFIIEGLSWSPNEDKIAFWARDNQRRQTLMVVDALTGNVTNYCIQNVTSDLFPIDIPAPIWSPDGIHLLVENRYAQDRSNLLVIDLTNKFAISVAENANPIGWMIRP